MLLGGRASAVLFSKPAVSSLYGSQSRWFALQAMKVPSLGDSITEGTVISFPIPIGGAVKVDDIVAVIETDKVSVDIRSPFTGVMKAFHAKDNQTVNIGIYTLLFFFLLLVFFFLFYFCSSTARTTYERKRGCCC